MCFCSKKMFFNQKTKTVQSEIESLVILRSESFVELFRNLIIYFNVVEFLNDSGKICKKFQGVSDAILDDFVSLFTQPKYILKTNLAEYATHISDNTGLLSSQVLSILNGLEKSQMMNANTIQNDAFLLNCTTEILNSNEVYVKFKPYLFKITANFFLQTKSDLWQFHQFVNDKTKFVKCVSSLNYIPRADFFYSFKHSHFTEFTRLVRQSAVPELMDKFSTVIEIRFVIDHIMEYLNMFPNGDPQIIVPFLNEDEMILPPFYPFKVLNTEIVKKTFYIKLALPCRWFLNQKNTNMLILRKTSLKYDKTHLFDSLSKFKEDKDSDFFPSICLSFPKFYLAFELMNALARNKHENMSANPYACERNIATILKVTKCYFKHLFLKNLITPVELSHLKEQFIDNKKPIETTAVFILLHNQKIKIYVLLFSLNVVNLIKYKIEINESKEARTFLANLVRTIFQTENFYFVVPFIIRNKENTEMLFDLNNIIRGLVDLKVTGKLYINLSGNDFSYFIINVLLDSESLLKNAKEVTICFAFNEIQEKSLEFILKLKLANNLVKLRLDFNNVKGFDQGCLSTIKSKLDFSDFNKVLVLRCEGANLKAEQAAVFIQSYQLEYQTLKLII